MRKPATARPQNKRILFGTTIGMSAMALLRGQLAWFRERGWDVTLVTTPDLEARRAVAREKVSFFGIQMKRHISVMHDLRSLIQWMRVIRQVRPDVVNLGTPKASLLGSVAAWVCRVPRRVYTVRGLRLEGASGWMTRVLWLMECLTIKMATDVIVVSASLGQELASRKLASPQDIWMIGNGSSNGVDALAVQRRIAQVDKRDLRERLGIGPSSFVVGYVGRVSSSKGIDILVDAVNRKELSDCIELLIIGSLEEKKLGEAIHGMGNRAHIVPWTDDVWGYLAAIDLLVLPTHREGFPNTVIEAAAAGIPAVTTRATGAIDSVIDGKTGFLIDINDVDALVDRLKLLSTDQKLLNRLGANAKERAQSQFRPPDIWRGIEAVALGYYESDHIKRLGEYFENSAPR